MKVKQKPKKKSQPKLRSFTLINDADPLDSFEVQAKNATHAHIVGLQLLGWWVAK